MDLQQLLAKMAELDSPVAEAPEVKEEPTVEDTVAECPPDMSAPVATPATPEPSMSVNMNAQGLNNIADLIKLIAKAEEEADLPAGISTPVMPPMGAPLPTLDMADDDKKDEWSNEPDEVVGDVDDVVIKGNDLHKSKRTYPKVAGGDNPMAMEGEELRVWVKNQLAQRLAEFKGAE